MSANHILALLDEIPALLAEIESKASTLPFAHHAARQAALATQALESELEALGSMIRSLDSLEILRAIPKFTTDNPKTFAECWLAIHSNVPASELQSVFVTACHQCDLKLARLILEYSRDVEVNFEFLQDLRQKDASTDFMRLLLTYLHLPTSTMHEVLLCACIYENETLVRYLLEEHEIYPFNALSAAIDGMNPRIIKLFLDVPVVQRERNCCKFVFSNACKNGYVEIVQHMLANNLVSLTYYHVYSACNYGHIGILCAIIASSNVDGIWENALECACDVGNIEIIRFLLDKGVHPKSCRPSIVGEILQRAGGLVIAQLLLSLPPNRLTNMNVDSNYAIRTMCDLGRVEEARLLLDLPLEYGVNPAENDNEPFRKACEHGHTEIVRLLLGLPLERGINPAANDNEAFRIACKNGHTEIVRLLLELPLVRGIHLAAGFRIALQHGQWAIFKLLLTKVLFQSMS